MNFTPNLEYPTEEQNLITTLSLLFQDWHLDAKEKTFIKGYTAENMVFDGFYPYFSKQKIKVLFVGREALCLEGNYLDVLYNCYKRNKVGDINLNSYQFHRLMFLVTYGLNNDFIPWDAMPKVTDMTASFATDAGISFAFMNLSKFSNDSGERDTDWGLIDSFSSAFEKSKLNYFNTEIEIINPDLIITMNLESRIDVLGRKEVIKYGNTASYFYLHCNDKKILTIDTFHFSASKQNKDSFYTPIIYGVENCML